MTIRATAGFGILRTEPGNPQFPTLPDGVIVPHVLTYTDGGGSRHYPNSNRGYHTKYVKASAPANDRQRFAGWQTETTWVNPAIIDFGVIPSPVRRAVSLYNARSTPMEVTALTLPSGVTLISPSLPVTLQPYDGATFTLEAGTTGDNEFDEFHIFTTSEGNVTFRLLGRRVFTLNNIPQTPMRESLRFRTDLIRSTDGTEKAYGLMQAPSSEIDYNVKFTNDIDRIRFKNQFIAGESALVVAGQKWYEARRLKSAAQSADLTLDVAMFAIDASWTIGGPISVVTEDGVATTAQLDSFQVAPDQYVTSNVLLLRFDGGNGETSSTDDSPNESELEFLSSEIISTAQSKFGGSSLLLGTVHPGRNNGVEIAYHPSQEFTDQDWTIDMWIRPTAADIIGNPMLMSRWETATGPGRSWYLQLRTTGIRFRSISPTLILDFPFGSPEEVQVDTWSYIRINRSGDSLFCFIDGVEIGTPQPLVGTFATIDVSPEMKMKVGDYYDSGFTAPYDGYIDDLRMTVGFARSIADFTPPTERHPAVADGFYEFTLGSQFGAEAPANSFIMPVGLGYVSKFPQYRTHARNLEEARYSLVLNQEEDFGALDPSFPTLTDLQSPENTLPILEFCNEIRGNGKASRLVRSEDALETGLSNRIAFSNFVYADNVSEFRITLYSPAEVWKWRTFLHYLRGSYGEFFVPTFTNDIPGVTTAASNVFSAEDTDLALLFGNPPDPRRNAVRFVYPNGTILYRMITAVVDNVATEQITVSSAVDAGNPEIGYLQRCRILGDTASFAHSRIDDVTLTFRFRTVLL